MINHCLRKTTINYDSLSVYITKYIFCDVLILILKNFMGYVELIFEENIEFLSV